MTCVVDGCQRPIYVKKRELCSAHYNRLITTGSVEDTIKARAPFEQRVWRQIEKRGPDECWPWTAKSKVTGYGTIGRGGRDGEKVLAHRAVWELTNGPIPKDGPGHHGWVVLHTCDNRLCCNPAHLRLGTQRDNVKDMDGKRRRKTVARQGEAHSQAKLTEADIRDIRASSLNNAELGRHYGVERQTIRSIRIGNTWSRVK